MNPMQMGLPTPNVNDHLNTRRDSMSRQSTNRRRQRLWTMAAVIGAIPLVGAGGADSVTGGEVLPATTDEPIVVGSILDRTGPINIYGVAMHDATELAIDSINEAGGVLGRQLELVSYDAQSSNELYTQYARTLALEDGAEVIMGGITERVRREAVRPIVDQQEVLYFYNEQYEGGVCDKNVFNTGVVPSQQLQALIPWAMENLGHASTCRQLTTTMARSRPSGSSDTRRRTVARSWGPSSFRWTAPTSIQSSPTLQQAGPDAIVSLLVGGNHIAFYRDFAARGWRRGSQSCRRRLGLATSRLYSPRKRLKASWSPIPYFQELESQANQGSSTAGMEYGSDYPYITDSAVTVWNGWHLWAAAVDKAGTPDRDKVIEALESGIAFDSPSGNIELDGPSHHVIQDVSIAEVNAARIQNPRNNPSVPPSFEQEVCDLIRNRRRTSSSRHSSSPSHQL